MLKLGWDLVWTIVNLIVLYLLMKRFLIGPVLDVVEKRKLLINGQMEHAKATQDEAEALKGQYQQAISSAKEESAKLIKEAKAEAKKAGEDIVEHANIQAADIIEIAKQTAQQEKEQALQSAKSEIAGLAMEAAKKLLTDGNNMDGNRMFYDEFLAKAGDEYDTDCL